MTHGHTVIVWILLHLTTSSTYVPGKPEPFWLTAKECEKVVAAKKSPADWACMPVQYPTFQPNVSED